MVNMPRDNDDGRTGHKCVCFSIGRHIEFRGAMLVRLDDGCRSGGQVRVAYAYSLVLAIASFSSLVSSYSEEPCLRGLAKILTRSRE